MVGGGVGRKFRFIRGGWWVVGWEESFIVLGVDGRWWGWKKVSFY